MGGTSHDTGKSITVDGSGNIYFTGHFMGTGDFDPGPGTFNLTSQGYSDIFISKLDASGNFQWAKSMGGAGEDESMSIAVASSGNIYTTGLFQDTVDFDPGSGTFTLSSAGGVNDIFISKLDASGNFLWAKSIGGTGNDVGVSIKVDGSGNVFITGHFQGTVDFDPGNGTFNLSSAGWSSDIFISKLDASGNFLWAKSIGGTGSDGGYSIAIDGSGNVYTTGGFKGVVDFDPSAGTFTLSSAGGISDIFISKLDSSGNFLWANSMGGTDADVAYDIALDGTGNIYSIGGFNETADFDPGPGTFTLTSAGANGDVFISKLNASGNFLWAKRMGGTIGDAVGLSIAVDGAGNVYAAGDFVGTVDFDPGTGTFNSTSAGANDIFLFKLDVSGNFLWVRSMGGASNDWGESIALDGMGNVYCTGSFPGSAEFDRGVSTYSLTSAGGYDTYVVKLGSLPTDIKEENNMTEINIFPNPFSTQVVLQSNQILQNAKLTLHNCFGQIVLCKENISGQTIVLNRDELASGIYYVRLTEGNKMIVIDKIIVTD